MKKNELLFKNIKALFGVWYSDVLFLQILIFFVLN
jgi:hypothetical protein